jgi:hypothetical protein
VSEPWWKLVIEFCNLSTKMAQVLKNFIDNLKSQIKTKKHTAKDANLFLAAVSCIIFAFCVILTDN